MTKPAKSKTALTVQVRCIMCKRKWWLDPATVNDMGPFCETCLMPATVEQAKAALR